MRAFCKYVLCAAMVWSAASSGRGQVIWREVGPNFTVPIAAVDFAGGQFVAVGTGGLVATSTNGLSWITRRAAQNGQPLWADVAFGNGVWVAVTSDGRAFRSSDGITWIGSLVRANVVLNGIVFGGGQFVAVGESGDAFRSSDGITWLSSATGRTAEIFDVAYTGGRFLATVGGGGLRDVVSSSDGVIWRATTVPGLSSAIVTVVTGTGGRFVVGMSDGSVALSDDGAVFRRRITPMTTAVFALGALGQVFAASDGQGSIFTSSDGETWLRSNATQTSLVTDFAFGGGIGVGTRFDGQFVVSANVTASFPLTEWLIALTRPRVRLNRPIRITPDRGIRVAGFVRNTGLPRNGRIQVRVAVVDATGSSGTDGEVEWLEPDLVKPATADGSVKFKVRNAGRELADSPEIEVLVQATKPGLSFDSEATPIARFSYSNAAAGATSP